MPFISNGTTILDNGAFSVSLGSKILIKEITASADATISFVHGSSDVVLDSSYPIYQFEFINIHPQNDAVKFQFQTDTGTNTNYNQTITSTTFYAFHSESGASSSLGYDGSYDQAQGTSFQDLIFYQGNDVDGTKGSWTIQEGSDDLFLINNNSGKKYKFKLEEI